MTKNFSNTRQEQQEKLSEMNIVCVPFFWVFVSIEYDASSISFSVVRTTIFWSFLIIVYRGREVKRSGEGKNYGARKKERIRIHRCEWPVVVSRVREREKGGGGREWLCAILREIRRSRGESAEAGYSKF